jgi:hypothetical protein
MRARVRAGILVGLPFAFFSLCNRLDRIIALLSQEQLRRTESKRIFDWRSAS